MPKPRPKTQVEFASKLQEPLEVLSIAFSAFDEWLITNQQLENLARPISRQCMVVPALSLLQRLMALPRTKRFLRILPPFHA